jgi:phosphoribosylformylglycinamidine synthase
VRRTLTPQLRTDLGETSSLILIDLGRGKNRLGASALAQVTNQVGNDTPDLDNPQDLKAFFAAIQQLNADGKLLAYHDRSDGGLYAALCEMAFAGRAGVSVNLDILTMEGEHASDHGDAKNWTAQVGERRNEMTLRALFNEELGAVVQVRHDERSEVMNVLRSFDLGACSHIIGKVNDRGVIEFTRDTKVIYNKRRSELHRLWSETSWRIARLRDNQNASTRNTSACWTSRTRASPRSWCTTPAVNIAAPFIAAARVRAWRSCASRASTRTSRPPGRCTRPASRPSTCT